MAFSLSYSGMWSVVLVVGCLVAYLCLRSKTILARGLLDDFVDGVVFYAIAFRGMLGPGDGEFGAIWMALFLAFAFYHVLFVNLASSMVPRALSPGWLMLPVGLIAYEYLRHGLAYLYDSSGLTFCLLGQSLVDSVFLPFASVAGIWGLSFLVGWISAVVGVIVDRREGQRHLVPGLFLASALGATAWACSMAGHGRSRDRGAIVVALPSFIDRDTIGNVESMLTERLPQAEGSDKAILGAETMVQMRMREGQFRFVDSQARLWRELSGVLDATVLVGAWISIDGRDDRINAMIQLRGGEVIAVQPKRRLAPYVESQPLGTSLLLAAGCLPEYRMEHASPAGVARNLLTSYPNPERVEATICYDLFFSQPFIETLNKRDRFLTCSLNETYDQTGVFQKLSMIHSRCRAVEAGRSLVRCSFGGATAAFDPLGKEIPPIVLESGMHVYSVPIRSTKTFYARTGDWIVWLSLASLVACVCRMLWRFPVLLGRQHGGHGESE